jgi:hypothetical protein
MATLHDADKVMAGSVPAVAVYAGAVKVWPSSPLMPSVDQVSQFAVSLDSNGQGLGTPGWPSIPAILQPNLPDESVMFTYYRSNEAAESERVWARWVWPISVCWVGAARVERPSGWGFTAPPSPTKGVECGFSVAHPDAPSGSAFPWEGNPIGPFYFLTAS